MRLRNIATDLKTTLFRCVCSLALGASLAVMGGAHDTWVQTNTNMVRVGDAVHIDLMLGNHGNEHRDFKLASKVEIEAITLSVIAPGGKRYDLKDRLTDTGYTPKEGYWTAAFVTDKPGMYMVAHTVDTVVAYAPERAIKSAKTFFVASRSLDKPTEKNPGFDKPLGHPLELIPVVNPVTPMGPGSALTVRLLYHGKPLANTKVSFIPRGATLKGSVDTEFERMTNAKGEATFDPKEANYYLIVAHRDELAEGGTLNGTPYKTTKYGATMTVYVPQICPCCGG